MDTIVLLNNRTYTHDQYKKYWELLCESVEPYSKVVSSNEIDDFMKEPFETVNSLAILVLDDYGSDKVRNWSPIINKLVTWNERAPGRKCTFIIADNHLINKVYSRDKRITIKTEWTTK